MARERGLWVVMNTGFLSVPVCMGYDGMAIHERHVWP